MNSPTFITVDLQAVSLLTDTLCSRAVIDNACIDESTKKNLSIIDIEEGTTYRFICK